ncbi:MAG: glycosyltransferase family 2 protein [Planctomycetes bacterium]|nr:glycosyltransferase family 2 protein [Planctomycetota bacterium]
MPELSVVLPCYNEAAGIPRLLHAYAEAGGGRDFELILVDNGSQDATAEVVAGLVATHPFVRPIRIERNRGYGDGIMHGLRAARADVLAWSHADLQTDPADVFRAHDRFLALSDQHALVKGRRVGRRLGERLVSRGMQAIALLALRRLIREINAQPKVFHRSLLDHLPAPPTDFNFDLYVLYQARRSGWSFHEIEVLFPRRPFGISNWSATIGSRLRAIARSIRFMIALGAGRHP